MLVASSAAKGVPFQRRPVDGDASVSTSGSQSTAPRWVKLVRAGNLITGYESPDGVSWTTVGSDTFTMGATVLVGLGVSSHVTGTNASATFDNVTVTPANPPPPANVPPSAAITSPATARASPRARRSPRGVGERQRRHGHEGRLLPGATLLGTSTARRTPALRTSARAPTASPGRATDNAGAVTTSSAVSVTVSRPRRRPPGLPAGWAHADIGTVPFAGDATAANGTFTVRGSGADVWGTADPFHYAYTTLTGDGTIVARVTVGAEDVNAWVKAGVMIRESLSAGAAHGFMLVSASKGLAFQRRPAAAGASVSSRGRPGRRAAMGQAAADRQSVQRLRVGRRRRTGRWWARRRSRWRTSVYVGLAVTSHTTARRRPARSITSVSSSSWQLEAGSCQLLKL